MQQSVTNVFIVDDSPIVCERLTAMLNEVEHVKVVGHASTAASALEKIWTLHPDYVILDIQMSGLSGIYVLEKMKKFPPVPKVIMLTNYPFPHFKNACMSAGADYFFDKSKDFEKIVGVIAANGSSSSTVSPS